MSMHETLLVVRFAGAEKALNGHNVSARNSASINLRVVDDVQSDTIKRGTKELRGHEERMHPF
jgi:hypothetical protein